MAPEDLAARTGTPVPEVVEHLRNAAEFPGAELDEQGRVLGLGLSLVGTRHRVRLDDRGQTLWAWCAPDALLLPNQVCRHATVTSSCGVTGTQVALELDGGRVTAARRD